jgi:hypothetical protein
MHQATLSIEDRLDAPTRGVLTQKLEGAAPVDVFSGVAATADLFDQVLSGNASEIWEFLRH